MKIAVSMIVSFVLVGLIIVIFVMFVFVTAHCRSMHNIAQHGATAAKTVLPYQIFFKKVVLKTSDVNYNFRVMNY